jgi:16S rRNA (cytosine967-C5)-methyltransferase
MDAKMGDAGMDLGIDFYESFDKILVDAPCSGLGTLRRNPEIKWRILPKDVKKCAGLQDAILENAVSYLKKGGSLIYCTCTIVPEENEKVIETVISRHSDLTIISPPETIHRRFVDDQRYFRSYPHRHGTDGFFGAALVKKN